MEIASCKVNFRKVASCPSANCLITGGVCESSYSVTFAGFCFRAFLPF